MREQTYSSVEQSRDTGNRPTQICLIMIFDTDAKAIQWRKTVNSTLRFWNKWVSSETRERQTIEIQRETEKTFSPRVISYTKITSKWILVLNVGCNTVNVLGKNMGENLQDLRLGGFIRLGTKNTIDKNVSWASSKLKALP